MPSTNNVTASLLRLAATVTLLAAHCCCSGIIGDKTFRLHLLHVNDMHSHFEQFGPSGMPCDVDPGADTKADCYGGFPRLKTAVNREKENAANRNPPVDGTVFLNAGDNFQGTAFYTFFKWKIVAELLPTLGIDVMSLGNHEFDDGVNDLDSFLQEIKIPVVACNLDLSKEPSLNDNTNLMKSKVLEVNGRKIGIIGYLTPETNNLSKSGNVKFNDEIESIRKEALRLKNEEKINIIIALGHSGFDIDVKIAEEVNEVDVVVGGHTNTFLYSGNPPDKETATGAYPYCVTQRGTGRQVPVVQAFHATKYLGQLWVEFDEDGEVLRSFGNPILLNSSIEQNSELELKVKNEREKFDKETKVIVGFTNKYLHGDGGTCRFTECNFGNFLTDAYVNYNIRHFKEDIDFEHFWTDAPIALQQGGGIREDISNKVNDGQITIYQLMRAIPFGNTVGKVTITGYDILNAIENSFKNYNGKTPRGEFLQVSGLKIVIDLSKPGGLQRIKSIQTRSPKKGEKNVYTDLILKEKYTVIINEYIWEGGNGFKFTNSKFKSFGKTDFEVAKVELEKESPISPTIEERIQLCNTEHIHEDVSVIPSYPLEEYPIYHEMTCGNNTKN